MKNKEIFAVIKLFLIIAFVMIPSLSYSQYYLNIPSNQRGIGVAFYYDGYWSEWTDFSSKICLIYGNYDSFIMYRSNLHPSNYNIKLSINNYHKPSKKDLDKNGWATYIGKIEYYVNEEHPTIKDVFKGKVVLGPLDGTHPVKRVADAKIKIKFKKHPKTYNIWFDDVGLAIDLGKAKFK